MAEFERDRIRERQRDGIAGKRAKGGYLGGSRPYGYQVVGSGPDATLVEDAHEQDGIRMMHELRASGAGYMRIAVELQRLGFPYVSHMSVKRILSRSITEAKTP
jgi:putative DNA-invertase from lambdoid prophage Rac